MEVAKRLGDERDLAMINLHLGRIYFFLNSYDEAMDVFKTGMEIVDRLGDEDIVIQSSQLLGVYYFMQGMNRQSVEHFERVMSATTYQERQLLDLGIPIYLGNSTALMGQYYRAVGVLDSNWRRAKIISYHIAARFLKADLGNILLMAGKGKKPSPILNQHSKRPSSIRTRSPLSRPRGDWHTTIFSMAGFKNPTSF